MKPERSEVGTLWSAVASVMSGRRATRPALRRPSKACGDVTSCTRWRSMYSRQVPSGERSTTCSSNTLSKSVRGPAVADALGDSAAMRTTAPRDATRRTVTDTGALALLRDSAHATGTRTTPAEAAAGTTRGAAADRSEEPRTAARALSAAPGWADRADIAQRGGAARGVTRSRYSTGTGAWRAPGGRSEVASSCRGSLGAVVVECCRDFRRRKRPEVARRARPAAARPPRPAPPGALGAR